MTEEVLGIDGTDFRGRNEVSDGCFSKLLSLLITVSSSIVLQTGITNTSRLAQGRNGALDDIRLKSDNFLIRHFMFSPPDAPRLT